MQYIIKYHINAYTKICTAELIGIEESFQLLWLRLISGEEPFQLLRLLLISGEEP